MLRSLAAGFSVALRSVMMVNPLRWARSYRITTAIGRSHRGGREQLPVVLWSAGAGLDRPASITVFPHYGLGKMPEAERSRRGLGSRVRNAARGRTLEP